MWVFKLEDLPAAFKAYSESVKRVIRPIYNAYAMHYNDESVAVERTLKNLRGRGLEPASAELADHGDSA